MKRGKLGIRDQGSGIREEKLGVRSEELGVSTPNPYLLPSASYLSNTSDPRSPIPGPRSLFFIFLFSFFTCLLLSCSQTEPRIPFGFIELVYYQDAGGPLERFSFFIIAEDDDGIENLGDLYLYNDYEQLSWHIASDEWVTLTESGNTWIGTRSIANLENETLPRGQYRAVLINKGGEKAERLLSFDAPAAMRLPFPSLEINEGRYTVNSLYPVNRLVCYDDSGNFQQTVLLDSLTGSIANLSLSDNSRTAALWAQDAQFWTSAFTNVAAIQR